MRTSSRLAFVVLGAAALATVVLAGPALAQQRARDARDEVVLSGAIVVQENETVGAAVIFDGPATIDGTVQDALVVFHGNVEITGTGEVQNDVVVFDGDVTVHSGAHVGGNLISTTTPTVEDGAQIDGNVQRFTGKLDWENIGVASRFAWWLAFTASALILGLLLMLFAPRIDEEISRVVADRPGAALATGLGWFFLLPVGAALLLVTVLGIPLAVFLLLGLALLYSVAYVVGTLALGRMIMKQPTSRYLALIVGLGIARVVALVPVLGGISFVLVALAGFGVLALAVRPKRDTPADEMGMPASPPPPPAPVTPSA
jgi:hypothetical protein